MIEKRPGYSPEEGCSSAHPLIVVPPRVGSRGVGGLINTFGAHVLVDLWLWSPLGRSVDTAELLASRPAPVTVSLLGSFPPLGGAADFAVTDSIVSPPEMLASSSRAESSGFMPLPFFVNGHRWTLMASQEGSELGNLEVPTYQHGTGSRESQERDKLSWPQRGQGLVLYAAPQYMALDPETLEIWLRATKASFSANVTLAMTVNPYAHVAVRYVEKQADAFGVRIRWHQRLLAEEEYLARAGAADLYGSFPIFSHLQHSWSG